MYFRWASRILLPSCCILLSLIILAIFISGEFELPEFDKLRERPFIPLLPLVDTNGGWTQVDINRRMKAKENRYTQHLDEEIEFSDADKIDIPSATNRTASTNVLVYNRVPKCASTLMQTLLGKLGAKNGFLVESNRLYHKHVLSDEEVVGLASKFRNLDGDRKLVYDGHFYYVDWKRFGANPILINMVREPISRVISTFYYHRIQSRWNNRKERPSKKWFEKDFESCVLNGDPECQYGVYQEIQLNYFCGREWECGNRNSRKALQKAKAVVEREYSVVGVLENLNSTLLVLEKYIPGFFSGASTILPLSKHMNKNSHPEPSRRVKDVLRRKLWADIELYQFIQQRLRMQQQEIL